MSDSPSLWEFVHCAICYTSWSDPPIVPFYATGCGHIVCNDHLNGDGSCASCGSANIEVVLLKNDPSEPISHWFTSVSHTLLSGVTAARFQVEMLSSLVRHYKKKSERYRHEREEFRYATESAQQQIQHLNDVITALRTPMAGYSSHGGSVRSDEGYVINSNGKRSRIGEHRASSSISFRSVQTPIQPARLTLPSDRPPPTINSVMSSNQLRHDSSNELTEHRPPSVAQLKQFAYHPQQASISPPSSNNKNVPSRHVLELQRTENGVSHIMHMNPQVQVNYKPPGSSSRSMPPPQQASRQTHTNQPRAQINGNISVHPQTPSRRVGMPVAPIPSRPFVNTVNNFSDVHDVPSNQPPRQMAPPQQRTHDQNQSRKDTIPAFTTPRHQRADGQNPAASSLQHSTANPTPNLTRSFGTNQQSHPLAQTMQTPRHHRPQTGISNTHTQQQRVFAPIPSQNSRPGTTQPGAGGKTVGASLQSTTATTQARFRPASVNAGGRNGKGSAGAAASGGPKRFFTGRSG